MLHQTLRAGRKLIINGIPLKDGAVVRFATFQLFVAIYLEKFAVGPSSFQVSLALVIMSISLVIMIIKRRVFWSPTRLGIYLMFIGSCLISQVLANSPVSIPSLSQLFLIYGFMATSAPLSETAYQRVLENFVSLMILPAVVGLIQYGYQNITGLGDPISMDRVFPKFMLLQGYFYDAHYPLWNDIFQRPNGFVFLEPSLFSFYTASAAIINITFFRRPFTSILMIAATVLSFGGTGLIMLVLASPFLIVRKPPVVVVSIVMIATFGLGTAYMLGANLPLISRMDELRTGGSGAMRLVLPFINLIRLISDPSYLLTGSGAGSTTSDLGSVWPIVKIINEYGMISMVLYVSLYISAIFARSYNLPLKIVMTVVFHFTGGYLMNAAIVQLLAVLSLIEPVQGPAQLLPRRDPPEQTGREIAAVRNWASLRGGVWQVFSRPRMGCTSRRTF